jgi:hypothetical protein
MEDEDEEFVHSRFQDQRILLAKYPTRKNQDIKEIMEKHDCPGFLSDLTRFINLLNDDILTAGHLRNASLPFNSLDIYHGFRFCLDSLGNDVDVGDEETDSVKAKPRSSGSLPRFDTVIVMVSDECESTGLQGKCHSLVLLDINLIAFNPIRNKNWSSQGYLQIAKEALWFMASSIYMAI